MPGHSIPQFYFASEGLDELPRVGTDSWSAIKEKFVAIELNEKFSVVYDNLKSKDDFPDFECHQSTKSASVALELKNLGNASYRRSSFVEALKLYNRSVAFALPDSEELAVAYANRSAALFHLKRYKACLVDVNRAISENYPKDNKVTKLVLRKKKCVEILRRDFQNLNTQEIAATDDETYKEYLLYKSKESVFDENATDMNYEEKFYLPKINFKSTIVPFASEKIKIKSNSKKHAGRHILATQNVQPGEVLSIEKPYASILLFELLYSHCSNCFVRCESMIPCKTCSLAMYCCKKCCDEAFNRYHKTECKILVDAKQLCVPPNVWLAVRVFLIATKQGQDLEFLMKHPIFGDPMKSKQSDDSEIFDSSDYIHIHNLEFNLDKRNQESLHSGCIMASLFLHLLKESEFFGSSPEKNFQGSTSLREKEIYAGNLLVKIILSLECNLQGIIESYRITNFNPPNAPLDMKNIGWGLYSFHSAFNHSCDGNATFYFHKNTLVCGSNRSIKTGHQICVSYAGYYFDVDRQERQEFLLKRYFFNCCCKACSKDWPLVQYMDNFNPSRADTLRQIGFFLRYQMMPVKPTLGLPYNATTLGYYREMIEILEDSASKRTSDFVETQRAIEQIFCSRANCYDLPQDRILLMLT